MKDFTKKLIATLFGVMAFVCANAAITVSSSNGVYTLTVGVGTTATDWTNLTSDVKAATSIKIVTTDGYELTSDDMTKICGGWNPITSVFTAVSTLNLENADIVTDNLNSDSGNDLWRLNRLPTLRVITFPKSAVYIPRGCLQQNSTVTEIILPDNNPTGTMTLSAECFSQMTALKKVVIGSAVQTLTDRTFQNISSLETVIFKPGVTTIGDNAFQNCTGIKSILLPESVTHIGAYAFTGAGIESIRLPNTLTYIGEGAFQLCTNVKTVTIPASVQTIGTYAFDQMYSLTDVYVLGSTTHCANNAFAPASTYKGIKAADSGQTGSTVNKTWYKYDKTQENCSNYGSYAVLHYPAAASGNYVNKGLAASDHQYALQDVNGNWLPNPANLAMLTNAYSNPDQVGNPSDYYGWNNFMLTAQGVEDEIWEETRVTDDRWYSMIFPFAMTKDQIEGAFGPGTEVCEFTNVSKTTATDANGKQETHITLYFSTDVTATDAHHPYMIHPSVKATASASVPEGPINNIIAGVDKAAALASEATASMITVNKDGYNFIGSYGVTTDTYIPKYDYYLGGGDGYYQLGFYRMMSDTTPRTWGYWTKYTAIVQPPTQDNASAKFMPVSLGSTDDETVTKIDVIAGAANDHVARTAYADKVFNMQGQVVRQGATNLDGLDKGIYVVNGKKYVVK